MTDASGQVVHADGLADGVDALADLMDLDEADPERERDQTPRTDGVAPIGGRSFDQQSVDDLLANLPDAQAYRPAIQALITDQRDLVRRWVDGFHNRRELLEWMQDATILTLGELPDDWFVQRAFTRLDLTVVLTSERRFAWADDPDDVLAPDRAGLVRRGVAAVDLVPACTRAIRRIRWKASEYVGDGDDPVRPDADVQDHPAMRPALTEMDDRQEWALGALLDGFESVDALLSWIQVVTEASYAEVPEDLAKRAYLETPTRERLLTVPSDHRHGPFFRESFAAKYAIPPFNRAAREVSERAGELVTERDTPDQSPMSYD